MDVLEAAKHWVDEGSLETLKDAVATLDFYQVGVDSAWLFQKLYLHACLRKQAAIAAWLENTVFPTLDPMQQVSIRQCFPYGHHLLRKRQQP